MKMARPTTRRAELILQITLLLLLPPHAGDSSLMTWGWLFVILMITTLSTIWWSTIALCSYKLSGELNRPQMQPKYERTRSLGGPLGPDFLLKALRLFCHQRMYGSSFRFRDIGSQFFWWRGVQQQELRILLVGYYDIHPCLFYIQLLCGRSHSVNLQNVDNIHTCSVVPHSEISWYRSLGAHPGPDF